MKVQVSEGGREEGAIGGRLMSAQDAIRHVVLQLLSDLDFLITHLRFYQLTHEPEGSLGICLSPRRAEYLCGFLKAALALLARAMGC